MDAPGIDVALFGVSGSAGSTGLILREGTLMKRIAEVKFHSILADGLPVRLHMRHDLHSHEKLAHVHGPLDYQHLCFLQYEQYEAVMLLGTALGIDLFMETARLRRPALNEAVVRFMGPLMRSCEINRMSGTPFYLLATLLAFGIFPKTGSGFEHTLSGDR